MFWLSQPGIDNLYCEVVANEKNVQKDHIQSLNQKKIIQKEKKRFYIIISKKKKTFISSIEASIHSLFPCM